MVEQKLHIGFLTNEYIIPPDKLDGGLATYIQKVGRELVRRGHLVSVFCLSERDYHWIDEGVDIYEVDSSDDFPQFSLRRIFKPVKGIEKIFLDSDRLAKAVWNLHKTQPIDILQASSYKSIGIAMCQNGVIPLVNRISSLTSLIRNAYGEENHISHALTDWCEIYQAEHTDGVISPSELMAKYYALLSGATPKVIRTPFSKSDIVLDQSFYHQNLANMKYMLYFGTLCRHKGVDILLKTIPDILKDYPDLHFVLIGRTLPKTIYLSQIEKLKNEFPVCRQNIHYFPSLNKSQLFPVIENSLCVIMPSRIDNYPNTCLEAQQFGKIVIGSKDSSLEEMIVDGQTGLLVESDPESLELGIRRFLSSSPGEIRRMENLIQAHVHNILSEDRVGNLINYYKYIIQGFTPNNNTELIDWHNLFLIDKYKINLWKGFIPTWVMRILSIIRAQLKKVLHDH